MATLVYEMTRMQLSAGGGAGVMRNAPWTARQTISGYTSTPAQSSVFSSSTNAISIQPAEDVRVAIGADPTADASDFKIAAGDTADFWVTSGHKISVRTA